MSDCLHTHASLAPNRFNDHHVSLTRHGRDKGVNSEIYSLNILVNEFSNPDLEFISKDS